MPEKRGCLSILFPFLRPRESSGPPGQKLYIFSAHESLLSPAERSFYGVLLQVLKGCYVVFAKVRLCDVLKHGNRQSLNKISQKHVDFVLCTPDRIAPVLAIELDDKSHSTPQRKERDEFVDLAFGAAELPIVHVPVKRNYSTAEVLTLISDGLRRWKNGRGLENSRPGQCPVLAKMGVWNQPLSRKSTRLRSRSPKRRAVSLAARAAIILKHFFWGHILKGWSKRMSTMRSGRHSGCLLQLYSKTVP